MYFGEDQSLTFCHSDACFRIAHLSEELVSVVLLDFCASLMLFLATGVTGFLLVLVVATMYIFALPIARQYLYFVFWKTHQLYVVLYILLVLHGSGRLVQLPIFQWFFIGPAVLYTVDRLISLSRRKVWTIPKGVWLALGTCL